MRPIDKPSARFLIMFASSSSPKVLNVPWRNLYKGSENQTIFVGRRVWTAGSYLIPSPTLHRKMWAVPGPTRLNLDLSRLTTRS